MLYLKHADRERLRAVVRRVFHTHPEFGRDHPRGDYNCDQIIEKLGEQVMEDYLQAVLDTGTLERKIITGERVATAKRQREAKVNARYALARKLHYP